jgi:hypothetical protein
LTLKITLPEHNSVTERLHLDGVEDEYLRLKDYKIKASSELLSIAVDFCPFLSPGSLANV